jgi:polyhydroxybutyrate depolymerase
MDAGTGAGGTNVAGAAGTTATGGVAGATGGSADGGSTGGAGVAGTTGSAGVTGAAGTMGSAGAAGNAGRGGTAGTAGTGGGGGLAGAGRGGNSGSAGGGSSGNGGAGGATSTGGTGGGGRSPGCGKAGSAKGAQHLDMSVGGRARQYWRWVPSGYDPNRPIPIIFAWHGSGGDGDEVRRTYFYLEPVVRDGAIILYPDGLPVNGGSSGWDLAAEGIDVKFFDAMLEAVAQDYCADLARVFSTGYSYGGMFSYALACSRGSKLRAIAPTAGAIFGGSSGCSTPVPAWIAHGTNDDLVPYSSAQSARDVWLRINGCGTATTPTSPSPCVAYQCPANAPVHWCVHNEGHEWPSFAAQGIWAFFSSR